MKKLPIIKKLKDIEKLENLGAEVSFEPQEEDMNPYDMYEDTEAKEVCERYESDGLEAWFCAKVSIEYKGMEANDFLGCCSYNSFKEFTTEKNGYYQDMINTCIGSINDDIEDHNFEVQKSWNIRKAKNLIKEYGLHIVSSNILQTV